MRLIPYRISVTLFITGLVMYLVGVFTPKLSFINTANSDSAEHTLKSLAFKIVLIVALVVANEVRVHLKKSKAALSRIIILTTASFLGVLFFAFFVYVFIPLSLLSPFAFMSMGK